MDEHKRGEEGEETLVGNSGNQSMLAKDLDASFAKIHERLANYFEEGNELRTRSSTSGAIEIVGGEQNEKLITLVNPRPSSIFARIVGKKGKKKAFQKWRHQSNSFSQIYKDTLSSNQLDKLLGPKQLDKNSRFKLPRVSSNSFLMADKLAKSYLPPRLSEISVSEEVAKRIFRSNPPKFTSQKQYPLVLSPSKEYLGDNLTPISALRQRVNSNGSSSSIDEENKSTAALASDFYGLDGTCNGDFLEELFLNTSNSSSSQMMSSSLSSLNESKINCSFQNEGNQREIGGKYKEDSFWKNIPSSNIRGELMLSKREESEEDSFGMEEIIEEIISNLPLETFNPKMEYLEKDEQISNEIMKLEMIDTQPLRNDSVESSSIKHIEAILDSLIDFVVNPKREAQDERPKSNPKPGGINEFGDAEFSLASCKDEEEDEIEELSELTLDFPIFTADKPCVNPCFECEIANPNEIENQIISEVDSAEVSLVDFDVKVKDEEEELDQEKLGSEIKDLIEDLIDDMMNLKNNFNEEDLLDYQSEIKEFENVEFGIPDYNGNVNLEDPELISELSHGHTLELKSIEQQSSLTPESGSEFGGSLSEEGIEQVDFSFQLDEDEGGCDLWHYEEELKVTNMLRDMEAGPTEEEMLSQMEALIESIIEKVIELDDMAKDENPSNELEDVERIPDLSLSKEKEPSISEPSQRRVQKVYPTTSEVEFTSSLIESLIEKVLNKEDISRDEVPEVKNLESSNSSPTSIHSPPNEAEYDPILDPVPSPNQVESSEISPSPPNVEIECNERLSEVMLLEIESKEELNFLISAHEITEEYEHPDQRETEDSDSDRPGNLIKSPEVCQTAHSLVKESPESSSRVYPSTSQMEFTSALIESLIEKVVNMEDISEDEETEEPEFATLSPMSIPTNKPECDTIPVPLPETRFDSSEISSTPSNVEIGCNDPEEIQRLSEVMHIECESGVLASQVPGEYREKHDETPVELKEECKILIPAHEIKEEYPDKSETIPPAKNIVENRDLDHPRNLSREPSEVHSPLKKSKVYPSTSQVDFTSSLIESMIEKIMNIESLSEDEDLPTDQPASSIPNEISSIFKEEVNDNESQVHEIHGLEIQIEDSFEDKEEEEIDQVGLRVQIEELINSVFEEAVDSTNKIAQEVPLVVKVENIEIEGIEPELDQVLSNKDLEDLRVALEQRIEEEEEQVVELEKDQTEPEPPSFTILKRKAGESESRLKIGNQKSSKNNRRTKSLEELKSEDDSKEMAKKPKKLRMKKHLGRWWKGSGMPSLLGVNPDEIDSEDYYKPIKPKETKVQEMEDTESQISIGHSESEEDELALIQKIGPFTQMDTPLSFSTQLLDSHRARKSYDFDKVGSSASSVSLNPNDVDLPDFKPLTKRKTISNLPKAIDFEYHKYAESISGSLSGSEIDDEAETCCLQPVVEVFGQNNLNPIWEEEFSEEDEVTPKEKLHDLIKVKDSKFRAFCKSILRFLRSLLSGIRRICGRKRVENTI